LAALAVLKTAEHRVPVPLHQKAGAARFELANRARTRLADYKSAPFDRSGTPPLQQTAYTNSFSISP
jgi:hypothetical protein